MARYDENYDIRDRARFLKPFIFPANGDGTILSKQAKRVFLSAKPAPLLVSQYCREQFQLGSLAHYLNARTTGYHDLPPFPTVAPDSSVRGVEHTENNVDQNDSADLKNRNAKAPNKTNKKDKPFYSNSENENDDSSSASNESGSGDSSSEESESEDSSENESKTGSKSDDNSGSEDDSGDSSSEETSSDESSDSEESNSSATAKSDHKANNNARANAATTAAPQTKVGRSNLDLLLDLGDIEPTAPIMTPSLGGFLTPTTAMTAVSSSSSNRFELVGPVHVSLDKRELLNKTNSHGLQINYRFTRAPHLYSAKMVSIELTFHNESTNDMENIRLGDKSALPANVSVCDFAPIAKLTVGQSVQGIVGIDWNDSTQAITFELKSSLIDSVKVSLKTTVGELIRAVRVTDTTFKEEQTHLRGMNEHTCKLDICPATAAIQHKIFEVANLALCANNTTDNGDTLLFAGQTMSSQSLVLVTVERCSAANSLNITVNCEKMVIGSMLLNEIKNAIKN